ncbi:MAG TPA: glycosyltransferase [Steroidobacteraceae bacterium]|nr:glycosyltransferase [Steroidobacteraceae bacterium]
MAENERVAEAQAHGEELVGPVRVLYLSDVYFPRVNGVSTSIATFRTDLADLDVETTLIAPEYPGPAELPGDRVVRVPSRGVPRDPEDRRMRWRALMRALASMQRGQFDLVHIQTPFIAHYAGVRHARDAHIPCLETYHTFFEEYLHHYAPLLPRAIARPLVRAFTRSQARQVDALVAPSEPMREVLLQYGVATPIHVLPTGLPADRFRPGDGERFRTLAALPPERPLLVYVGRIAFEKNIEFLISSFAIVRRTAPQAMLVIAGEGPAEGALRRLVAKLGLDADVRFVGYLDRNRALLDCYAAAQAFVFASRTETQGLVLLEAMAQGAPVVSTASLGTRSVLKPECGAIVVPEREEDFAAAALRVLGSAELRTALAARSRSYAQSWSSLRLARSMADLYRSVCERSASRAPARAAALPARSDVGVQRQ